jgi:signal transduction histidine kinase
VTYRGRRSASYFRIRVLSFRAKIAVHAERVRIAQDLHDSLAQDFTGMMMHIDIAEMRAGESPDASVQALQEIRAIARKGLGNIRSVVGRLRADARTREESLLQLIERLAAATTMRGAVAVSVRQTGTPIALTAEVRHSLTRICQEALTNAERHARASRAEVHLHFAPQGLCLSIRDNGRGGVVQGAGGFGLTIMAERVAQLGGTLEIDSPPGEGTCITVRTST